MDNYPSAPTSLEDWGDHECRFSILTFPYLIFVVFDETERRNSTNRKFLIGISIIWQDSLLTSRELKDKPDWLCMWNVLPSADEFSLCTTAPDVQKMMLAPHFRPDWCFYLQIAPHSSPVGRHNKTASALSSNSRYPPRATRGFFAVKVRAKLFELTISG